MNMYIHDTVTYMSEYIVTIFVHFCIFIHIYSHKYISTYMPA